MKEQAVVKEIEAPVVRRVLSVQEFADELGVAFDSVYRRVQSSELKSVRFGRRILIPRSELDRVLEEGL